MEELEIFNFGTAIEILRTGGAIARKGWNGKNMFVCKQKPSEVNGNIIPKMTSLFDPAKALLHDYNLDGTDEEDTRPIFYVHQMIIVNTLTREINSWVPSVSDIFAEDWYLVNE